MGKNKNKKLWEKFVGAFNSRSGKSSKIEKAFEEVLEFECIKKKFNSGEFGSYKKQG